MQLNLKSKSKYTLEKDVNKAKRKLIENHREIGTKSFSNFCYITKPINKQFTKWLNI